ncbi:MAG: transposase [Gemmatimonadota bacterium]
MRRGYAGRPGDLRSRDALVRALAGLIDHVRGTVKAVVGGRLPSCGTPSFHWKIEDGIPEELEAAFLPVVDLVGRLSEQIRSFDGLIEGISEIDYPETALLRQVPGVGPVTALCYVLTLEDPDRFPTSRAVGPYLGLVPRRHDSGDFRPQLRTTKAGDPMLRRLLVQAAHYTLGPFGPDTDLRRWGDHRAGWEEREETSHSGGGPEVGRSPPPPLGHGRSLRAASTGQRGGGGVSKLEREADHAGEARR